MIEQPINHIYIYGWFDTHALMHANDIERFISLAEEGVFILEHQIPGVKIYRYNGEGASTRVHWFSIDVHGQGSVVPKVFS